ncbi:histone-lysine N-methyltransferase SETMAR [Trichonephila clavata]|uniref:Histone-lysine N-methyltransferase SETMAR n=1 Tax=Trichonephila clavata TaxID=2740835 RepID=A0A8X6G2Q7_TRICU|nr:histone-lysine N-methyltransferase SETMAR [Trichonephila clavata]
MRRNLSQIVNGDETWCNHFEPESKRQSKQLKRATSPPRKKSKVTSSGKIMMAFFLAHKGPLLVKFLERGATSSIPSVTTALYRTFDEPSS